MIDRAIKPMAAAATLAVLAAALMVLPHRPPAPEACVARSLQDLAAWRWVEPRLSAGLAWQPCMEIPAVGRGLAEVRCPSGHSEDGWVSVVSEVCDAAGRQHAAALRALLLRADKTDEAVKTLESLAPTMPPDARLLSDLAAAYLVRARRIAQPIDLLSAFDAALQAVGADASLPAARFNLALAEEALGLPAEWDAYLSRDRSSSWAGEARVHARRLAVQAARIAATSWTANRQRLVQAAGAGDRAALAEIIKPFPAAAQRYLEEEVLPGWARELSQGRSMEAGEYLAEARAIAAELADQTGDHYMAEAVGAISSAAGAGGAAGRPAKLQALIEGHLALAEARAAQEAEELNAAGGEYRQAGIFLASAGSPLRAGADLGLALVLFQRHGASLAEIIERVGTIEREARLLHHGHLLGRALWIRALCLSFQGRSLKALTAYDEAIRVFERLGDREDVASVRARRAGVFRTLGESALAWEEIFQALPDLPWVVDLRYRHHLLGEAAAAAGAEHRFQSALWLQTRAVDMIKEALTKAGREGTEKQVKGLRFNLAVSVRARASIEVDAGRHEAAGRDLARAHQLVEPEMLAVLGREQLASGDPGKALATFADALRLAPAGENRSLVASLHFQVAMARLNLGQRRMAEADFQAGIRELRSEEKTLLEGRRRGQSEEIWTAYFSRFQQAYRSLIRLLLEDGRGNEAFDYAEEARAFEPLDLVLRQPFAPAELLQMTGPGGALKLPQVQQFLPARTFLSEYCLLDDRLVVWVVSRTDCKVLIFNLSREILARWTQSLQASTKNVEAFEAGLTAPFPDIVSEQLQLIRTVLGRLSKEARVVFVPDGSLHGLPFSALRDRATGRRVIDDCTVSIAPSATLYVYSRLRDAAILRQQAASSVLLIGDPISPSTTRLPGAAEEIRRLGELYPGATVRTGEQATAERFLALARNSSIVHFAGHAFADSRHPSRSFLLFTPTRDHPGELYAEELLGRLSLPMARLVVLSSCSSTADGAVGPQGLAPLVRPLIAAGAPAVVASLWKVQDQATAELLVRFHRYYVQGQDAAGALRHAQLDLESKPVLFWAPFQVIGHAESPFPPTHIGRPAR